MLKSVSLAAAAALVAASAAPAAHADPDACFTLRNISGTTVANPRTVYVRADGGHTYRIEFQSDCSGASSYSLVMHPTDNSGRVCKAIELDVHVRDTGESCIPSRISQLTPDEVAALPPKDKP